MKILLVSATPFEINPTIQFLKQRLIEFQPNRFQKGPNGLDILVTGVGIPATIFSLTDHLSVKTYDLIINAGIAGSFNRKQELGSVWQVIEDRFGDLGVELGDGSFEDLFDIELAHPNEFPFQERKLTNNEAEDFNFLPKASALTINKVHGSEKSIERIRQKYPVDLESMEGAAAFYVAKQKNTSILQIRAISNYVEKRNREAWEIGLAIENLNQVLIQIITSLL
jgi:futalosine hydrolase